MAEITQHFGFDATNAIATLKELDAALGGVNRRLTTFNSKTGGGDRRIIQGFAQLSKEAQTAEKAVAGTATALKKTGETGAAAGQSITLSWATMVKAVTAQTFIRALHNAIQLFGDSADAAHDFQIEVAKISTIAQGPGSSIDELSGKVRELAIELGRPVQEVASAAYETLQNDIGNTAESFDFLRQAADLAIAQGSEIADSVNTITSVLKSYGLEVSETADITDTLFVAIDKGRITLDEIADKLGTVVPLSASLGVNFQETAAAVASLTQSGLDSATAMTQLRNVLQKLFKPSKDLESAFAELGVTSGTELIEKFGGLQGALNALKGAFDGNEQAVARAFGTIRGQLGVLNFLAQEGTLFNETLEAMEDRGGRAAEAIAKVNDTDARKADKEFAQLSDTILEVGETAQRLRTTAVSVLNEIIPNARAATVAVTALGAAFLLMGGRAAIASKAIQAALLPLRPALLAIGLAVTAAFVTEEVIDFIQNMESAGDAIENTRKQATEAAEAAAAQSIARETQIADQATSDRIALSQRWVDSVAANYQTVVQVAAESERSIVTGAETALARFVKAREGAVSAIEQAIGEIDDRILDATDRIKAAVTDLADFNFERGLRDLNESERVTKRIAEANRALEAARRAAANAGIDEKSQADARELQAIAEKKAAEALSAADRLDNEELIRRAESLTRSALQQDIATEKQLRQNLADFKESSGDRELADAKARFAEEEELVRRRIELEKKFDNTGKRESAEQEKKDAREILEINERLAELFAADAKVDLFEKLGVQDFVDQTSLSLVESLESATVDWSIQAAAIQAVLDSTVFKAAVQVGDVAQSPTGDQRVDDALSTVDRTNPAEAITQSIKVLEDLKRSIIAANAEAIKTGEIYKINKTALDETLATDTFHSIAEAARFAAEGIDESLGPTVKRLQEQFNTTPLLAFREQLKLVSQELPGATSESEASIQSKINEAKLVLQRLIEEKRLSAEQAQIGLAAVEQAERALQASIQQKEQATAAENAGTLETIEQKLLETENAINQADLAPDSLKTLTDELGTAKQNAVDTNTAMSNVGTSARTAATNTTALKTSADGAKQSVDTIQSSMQLVVGQTQNATQAMNALAAAAREAALAAQSATNAANFAYHGGKVDYRAAGGPISRGADTRLTVTEPGEMIVNSRDSRNFAAELHAMNSHQRPVFRDKGGTVTNVGDVNVNIHTSSAEGIDGDHLGRTIRRQLRRETLSL